MLRPFFQVLIKFIIILHYVNSESSLKQNGKESTEENFQMCIDSFDVHKDKIIRTQDSLALGAKYIMESEVDDRQNCLKLCCKTDDCDVFIFEEKKQGSCYLFHCGPPHDFKCKFTSHANYSSAVRLEEQMRRSQQEHELKSLRKISDRVSQDYSYTEASIHVTEAPKIVHVSTTTTTTMIPKILCSRNQYECRTSKDCIAIYNVCDGIPQCSDGSDEASELGCPTEKPTPPPVAQEPPLPPASELFKYSGAVPHHTNYPSAPYSGEIPVKAWPIPIFPHQELPQQQNVQYPSQGIVVPLAPVNFGAPGYNNEWDHQPVFDQNKEGYPTNSNNGKNDVAHYSHEKSHIFNHKRPGITEDNAGNEYIDPQRPYEPYFPQPNHGSWQKAPPKPSGVRIEHQASPTVVPLLHRKDGTQPVIVQIQPVVDDTTVKEKASIKKELETQKNLHTSPKAPVEIPSINKKDININKVTEQHTKVNDKHEEVRMHHFVAEHLRQNNINTKETYEVLRPKGAVISLALGLTVTAIMVALITCRLRVVRRRGRRGHGPYGHDADYLVNGMYL